MKTARTHDAVCVGGPYDGQVFEDVLGASIRFFGDPVDTIYEGTSRLDPEGRLIYEWVEK